MGQMVCRGSIILEATHMREQFNIIKFSHNPLFICIEVIFCGILIMLMWRLRVKSMLIRQNLLESLVKERTSEIENARLELIKFFENDRARYASIMVGDEYRSLLIDALNGFSDYAQIKGYQVRLRVDTRFQGVIYFAFEVVTINMSTAPIDLQQDVDDYVNHLRLADNLNNMPMLTDSIQHSRLVAALQTRFSYLRMQVDMLSMQNDFYKRLLEGWSISLGRGTSTIPSINFNISNNGGENMRDKYSIKNSQNVAQGQAAHSAVTGNSVQIGRTYTESTKQVDSLRELEAIVEASTLTEDIKASALRYLRNTQEEIVENTDPDVSKIGNWLIRTNSILRTAGATTGLLDKLGEVLTLFGLGPVSS